MQKATSCRYLLILGIKLLLQKFDANLAISNPRYLELFFDTVRNSGVLLYSESRLESRGPLRAGFLSTFLGQKCGLHRDNLLCFRHRHLFDAWRKRVFSKTWPSPPAPPPPPKDKVHIHFQFTFNVIRFYFSWRLPTNPFSRDPFRREWSISNFNQSMQPHQKSFYSTQHEERGFP